MARPSAAVGVLCAPHECTQSPYSQVDVSVRSPCPLAPPPLSPPCGPHLLPQPSAPAGTPGVGTGMGGGLGLLGSGAILDTLVAPVRRRSPSPSPRGGGSGGSSPRAAGYVSPSSLPETASPKVSPAASPRLHGGTRAGRARQLIPSTRPRGAWRPVAVLGAHLYAPRARHPVACACVALVRWAADAVGHRRAVSAAGGGARARGARGGRQRVPGAWYVWRPAGVACARPLYPVPSIDLAMAIRAPCWPFFSCYP